MMTDDFEWHDVAVDPPAAAECKLLKCTDGAVWPGFLRHDGKWEVMKELGPPLDVRFWAEWPEMPKADGPELKEIVQ